MRGLCFRVSPPVVRSCVVRPSVNTYFAWCNISSLSGGISMTLSTSDRHMSGRCWKGFQGQRSNDQGHSEVEKIFRVTNNHHVSGHCWKGYQGQRSNVKVIVTEIKCTFAVATRRLHVDGIASRFTYSYCRSAPQLHFLLLLLLPTVILSHNRSLRATSSID